MLSHKRGKRATASAARPLVGIMPPRVLQVFRGQVEPMLALIKAEEVADKAKELHLDREYEMEVHEFKLQKLRALLSSLPPKARCYAKRANEAEVLEDIVARGKEGVQMARKALTSAEEDVARLRRIHEASMALLQKVSSSSASSSNDSKKQQQDDGEEGKEEEKGGEEEEEEEDGTSDSSSSSTTTLSRSSSRRKRRRRGQGGLLESEEGTSPPSSSSSSSTESGPWLPVVMDKSDVLDHIMSYLFTNSKSATVTTDSGTSGSNGGSSERLLAGLGSVNKACRAGVQGALREVKAKCGAYSWSVLKKFHRLQTLHIVGATHADPETWSLLRYLPVRLPEIAKAVATRVTTLTMRGRRANSEKKAKAIMEEVLQVRWPKLRALKLESWMFTLVMKVAAKRVYLVPGSLPLLDTVGGWGRKVLQPLSEVMDKQVFGSNPRALAGRCCWKVCTPSEAQALAKVLKALPATEELSIVEFNHTPRVADQLASVFQPANCLTNLRHLTLELYGSDGLSILLKSLEPPSSVACTLETLSFTLRRTADDDLSSKRAGLSLPRLRHLRVRLKGRQPQPYHGYHDAMQSWRSPLLPIMCASPALEEVEVTAVRMVTLSRETLDFWKEALATPTKLRRVSMDCPGGRWTTHLLQALGAPSSRELASSLRDLTLNLGNDTSTENYYPHDPPPGSDVTLPADLLPNLRTLRLLGCHSGFYVPQLLSSCGSCLHTLELTAMSVSIKSLHSRSQLWPLPWMVHSLYTLILRSDPYFTAGYPFPNPNYIAGILGSLKVVHNVTLDLPLGDEFIVRFLRLLGQGRPPRLQRLDLNWDCITRGGVLLLGTFMSEEAAAMPRGMQVVGLGERLSDWTLTGGE